MQTIETRFHKGGTSSIGLFYSEIAITSIICIFEVLIGIQTTVVLNQTGLRSKWPFYLIVWVILLSYIVLQLFQAFLYIDTNYFDLTQGDFNTVQARLISLTLHEGLIFLAMFVIVWHTNRINSHTLMMLKKLSE
jgi:hypothetical protein